MTAEALVGAIFLKPMLVVAAAATITACLRPQTAAARHAVWAAALLLVVALPVLGLALPPLRVPLLDGALTLPWRDHASTAPSHGPAGGVPSAAARALLEGGVLDGVLISGEGSVHWLPEAIAGAWLLGVLTLGLRRILMERRLHRILRRSQAVSNPRLGRLLADAVRASGVRRRVEVRLSKVVSTPAVTGGLRPVVLLPMSVDIWPDEDVAAALAHELGHVARHDCLLNLAADLATAIYWCNPAVHVAARRMRGESERACDDRVLRGGAEPEDYARLLVDVARRARISNPLPVAVSMARAGELESRLLAVLDQDVRRGAPPRWLSAVLAGLGAAVALPIAALTLAAAPVATTDLAGPEPDLRGDSLTAPASELVSLPPSAYRLSPAAVKALAGPDSALAWRLAAALEHKPVAADDLIRERAAWALSQASDGRLVEPLLEALHARDWRVSAYAAWALATADEPRAVPALVALLDHPVWRLRAMAAYALRVFPDPRAEAAMDVALRDPAWQVRAEAVRYFSTLGGSIRLAKLRPRLDDRHIAVRLAAEQALAPL